MVGLGQWRAYGWQWKDETTLGWIKMRSVESSEEKTGSHHATDESPTSEFCQYAYRWNR